jgi:hypothetical protein
VRGSACLNTFDPMVRAEDHAPYKQNDSKKKKKGDGREIAQDIFLIDASTETRNEEQRKSNTCAKRIEFRPFISVKRRNRDITYAGILKIERD